MVIRLSPTLQKRVERAAKAEGVTLSKWLEDAVKQRLAAERKPPEQVSEARRQLNELLKDQKPPEDFMAAVHDARRYARQLEEDNADWLDMVMTPNAQQNDRRAAS